MITKNKNTFFFITILLFLSYLTVFSQKKNSIENIVEKCNNNDCFEILIKEFNNNQSLIDIDKIPMILPLKLEKIELSSIYGNRMHPIEKKIKKHQGIDLAAPYGTIVYAPAQGVVESIKHSLYGYGNKIVLRHCYGFKTIYAHLSYIYVKKGQIIAKKQIIGFVGNSGSSTGSHLHYEIKKNNRNINPNIIIKYL